jgi:antitoxin VapB
MSKAGPETGVAKVFTHERSQAVRLPSAFHHPGDIDAWFAELDRFADVPFMEDGRRQSPMPEPK